MKVFAFSVFALMVSLFTTNTFAESTPNCNSDAPRCIAETEFDNTSATSCLDVKAYYGGCTPMYGELFFYSPYCAGLTGATCATLREYEGEEYLEVSELEEVVACGGSGYCGWRDGVNKTGSSSVGNAARAKLHVCASGGIAEESYWDTLSECTSNAVGQTKHAKNDYCTDSVWDTLCDGWL